MASAITGTTGGKTGTLAATNKLSQVDPQAFLNIMVKELQQQDPFEPVSSKDLITQVGQIQGIQSSMTLTQTLQDLSLSQKLGAASNLLGKQITGLTSSGESVNGLVTSVRRDGSTVYLELDTGQQLDIANVLTVNTPTAAATTGTTAASTPSTIGAKTTE